jgi:hypothetical protein
MEVGFLNEENAGACRHYDSMTFHVSMFAEAALCRRGSLERCSQLIVVPFPGNGTIYLYFGANC